MDERKRKIEILMKITLVEVKKVRKNATKTETKIEGEMKLLLVY